MKKGPFKMKGPGMKAKKKLATPGRKFASGNISGRIDMTLNNKLNEAVRRRTATVTDRVSKKPASLASRAFRSFKTAAKIMRSRAMGVGGMMMGTMGTADANPKMKLGASGKAARRLFNKRKNK